jgi:hypothetical protein
LTNKLQGFQLLSLEPKFDSLSDRRPIYALTTLKQQALYRGHQGRAYSVS